MIEVILREKGSDTATLIWHLDHTWKGESWNRGRVFFKAPSNAENYEYRVSCVVFCTFISN